MCLIASLRSLIEDLTRARYVESIDLNVLPWKFKYVLTPAVTASFGGQDRESYRGRRRGSRARFTMGAQLFVAGPKNRCVSFRPGAADSPVEFR